MYPNLFGIEGLTMSLLVAIGFALASVLIFIYLKKKSEVKVDYIALLIVILVTAISGLIFAVCFENIYEAIKNAVEGKEQSWTWSATWYGGLLGGVLAFLLMYYLYYRHKNDDVLDEILRITPAAICLGHGIGRLGCFFNGCCYGIETDAWYGVLFPGHTHKVIPTQLFEMAFLLILATILIVVAFKKKWNYSIIVYLYSYAIFRFLIEFIRGDERGELPGLSPSQYWCIVLVIIATALIFVLKKVLFKKENKNEI